MVDQSVYFELVWAYTLYGLKREINKLPYRPGQVQIAAKGVWMPYGSLIRDQEGNVGQWMQWHRTN